MLKSSIKVVSDIFFLEQFQWSYSFRKSDSSLLVRRNNPGAEGCVGTSTFSLISILVSAGVITILPLSLQPTPEWVMGLIPVDELTLSVTDISGVARTIESGRISDISSVKGLKNLPEFNSPTRSR